MLQKPGTQRAFLNSLLLGTLVGIIGTALGFLFAFTVSRANLRPGWVRLIDAMTLLPLISPPFTTSIAFIFSFGPRGLITYELLGIRGTNVYGLASTLAAEVLTYFPDRLSGAAAGAGRDRRQSGGDGVQPRLVALSTCSAP